MSKTSNPEYAKPPAIWVKPVDLRPWPDNPRTGKPVEEVMESIRLYGFGAPVVARLANSEIIKGHTRVEAAIKLGLEMIPVRFLDLTEAKAHALALADNRIGEIADWEEDKLDAVLKKLDDEDRALLDGIGQEDESPRKELEVKTVDVSEAMGATFFMVVRGPLPKQPEAIERLRASLSELEGVEVDLGGVA